MVLTDALAHSAAGGCNPTLHSGGPRPCGEGKANLEWKSESPLGCPPSGGEMAADAELTSSLREPVFAGWWGMWEELSGAVSGRDLEQDSEMAPDARVPVFHVNAQQ